MVSIMLSKKAKLAEKKRIFSHSRLHVSGKARSKQLVSGRKNDSGIKAKIQSPKTSATRLISSMTLGELLEASSFTRAIQKGEKVPISKSNKVRMYAGIYRKINMNKGAQELAKQVQDTLTQNIVERNSKTLNPVGAKKAYQEFISEDKK